jgi:hypothetical protein
MHKTGAAIAAASLFLLARPLLAADAGDPLAFRVPTEAGQDVSMKGYLFFDFENKNLYATPRWEDAGAACVPLDFLAKNTRLSEKVKQLNHSYVLVRGRIVDFSVAPPGQEIVDLEHCRDIGLMLESIEPAPKN